MTESPSRSFTGRQRDRRTRPSVKISDGLARATITVGGIGTIVAVLLVGVYLVWVAAPLFFRSGMAPTGNVSAPWKQAKIWHVALDEYQRAGWALLNDGEIVVFLADSGQEVERRRLVEDAELTAFSISIGSEQDAVFGFADGSVRFGKLGFSSELISNDQAPAAARQLAPGAVCIEPEGIISRSAGNDFRRQKFVLRLDEPLTDTPAAPVQLLDHVSSERARFVCGLWGDGTLRINRYRKNNLTGAFAQSAVGSDLPGEFATDDRPLRLLLSALADNVFVTWDDGRLVRYDTRAIQQPQLAEKLDLLPEENLKLKSATWLLGRSTLMAGDSSGRINGWFRTKPEDAETIDRNVLMLGHTLPAGASAVTALAASAGSRVLAAGFADGSVRLYQVTNESLLAELPPPRAAISALTMSTKEDRMLAIAGPEMLRLDVHLQHPEATLAGLFRPVWFEGYERPEHAWQSSSGTNEEEPKLGLVPLIFGTLKATFYSLLIGVPLALAAAVFTCEFLHRRVRARIKPAIEMMASLPSVVLGFIGGLIVAPVVEQMVPAVLLGFFIVPLVLLLSAYLWQLAPQRWTLKLAPARLLLILALLPLGFWLSIRLGPVAEKALLGGDFKAWVDGQVGSGIWAWMLLFLPLSAAGILVASRELNSWLKKSSSDWGRSTLALADLTKFIAGAVATFALAWCLSRFVPWAVSLIFNRDLQDPRGSFISTYDQRNALVVGFMMGFAIIPLIYTIADDALAAVPDHLRSASLGAGATPWQTATRIVIPTAMSGLFSAVMIGLGRAVGETMIVLMAAGNTPIMDLNLFNGFRTLSANIAVEMGDAPPGSTHYRILFLSALVLFAMTFVVNTLAEVIRQRFRRRSHEL